MFGYVLPPSDLPPQECERFRRMYCGLCRVLGTRYGSAARWTLNYDFTWLAILLSDSGPDKSGTDNYSAADNSNTADDGSIVEYGRCPFHPMKPRSFYAATRALELAADESVILAWWQLQDAAEDRGFSLPERCAAAALRGAYEKAAAYRPAFDGAVRRHLDALHALEREKCASLDRPADAFASLLREAAEGVEPTARRRVLEQILYHLGRWIYLIDAADDLKRDAKSGDYNPVTLRYTLKDGVWTAEARREFASTLDQSVAAMAAAYELWDFGPWSGLLEAVLYRGLFRTGRSVLDGTFRRMPWHRQVRPSVMKQERKQERNADRENGGNKNRDRDRGRDRGRDRDRDRDRDRQHNENRNRRQEDGESL